MNTKNALHRSKLSAIDFFQSSLMGIPSSYQILIPFLLGILMVIYLFVQIPLLEWILTMLMLIWILTAAIQSISFKFFSIPGMYYKRSQYPEALELFENAFQVLDNLGMRHDPIAETIQKNIDFIKTQMEKKPAKYSHN